MINSDSNILMLSDNNRYDQYLTQLCKPIMQFLCKLSSKGSYFYVMSLYVIDVMLYLSITGANITTNHKTWEIGIDILFIFLSLYYYKLWFDSLKSYKNIYIDIINEDVQNINLYDVKNLTWIIKARLKVLVLSIFYIGIIILTQSFVVVCIDILQYILLSLGLYFTTIWVGGGQSLKDRMANKVQLMMPQMFLGIQGV